MFFFFNFMLLWKFLLLCFLQQIKKTSTKILYCFVFVLVVISIIQNINNENKNENFELIILLQLSVLFTDIFLLFFLCITIFIWNIYGLDYYFPKNKLLDILFNHLHISAVFSVYSFCETWGIVKERTERFFLVLM